MFRSDWELVECAQKGEKAAYVELWDKYFLLRQREKHQFVSWCKSHKISYNIYQEYYESWDSDAWEKFKNQMPGLRLNELKAKGYNSEKWKIAIRLIGYFQVVNRSYSTKILKELNNKTAIESNYDDNGNNVNNIDIQISNSYDINNDIKNIAKKVFNKAWSNTIKEMSSKQKELISLKENKTSNKVIMNTLNVSNKDIKTFLNYSKSRLSYWIENVSKKENVPLSYNDVLSLIQ